jgi:HD-GYP domain-containing protein (c-di-GMP phosphodiesterase class II)
MPEKKSVAEKWGHDFIRTLYHMINTVRMYQDNNQLVRASVNAFQNILKELTAEADVGFLLYRGRFHLGGEKIPYRRDLALIVYNLIDFFSKRGVGALNFLRAAHDTTSESIIVFSRLFSQAARQNNPFAWLEQKLDETGATWIQISPRLDEDTLWDGESLDAKRYERARKNYFMAVEAVREVARKVAQGIAGIRKSKRIAQNFVDLIRVDPALMIGLSTIKQYDDYTYTHSVNVALLATCLGRHIDLSDITLEHLTICGLFHDLGKVEVPREVLLKKEALTNGEWDLIKAHPVIGVKNILLLNADPSLRSRIILGPFEHHINQDMTGYPSTLFRNHLSLIGKILHIADVYEAMTHDRIYRSKMLTPDMVLREMWKEAGKSFDRILLKRFIHMMGVYPIGSVVELSDGGIGLVMDYPDESERTQPLVLRLTKDDQGAWQRRDVIYLADPSLQEASAPLKIVGVRQPAQLGINPAEFFLRLK